MKAACQQFGFVLLSFQKLYSFATTFRLELQQVADKLWSVYSFSSSVPLSLPLCRLIKILSKMSRWVGHLPLTPPCLLCTVPCTCVCVSVARSCACVRRLLAPVSFMRLRTARNRDTQNAAGSFPKNFVSGFVYPGTLHRTLSLVLQASWSNSRVIFKSNSRHTVFSK